MDPRAAEDYDITEAAAFVAESRTARPGTWANGSYDVGKGFMSVCMFAREQQDAAFAAQSENGTANTDVPAPPPPLVYPTTPSNGIDLAARLLVTLLNLVQEQPTRRRSTRRRTMNGELVMHLLALRLFTAAPRHSGKPTRNPTRNSSGRHLGRNGIVLWTALLRTERMTARRMPISKFQ